MNKITKFGIAGLMLVVLVSGAFAYLGGNEAANAAIQAGDYDAWQRAKMSEITEERFNELQERHEHHEQRRAELDAAMLEGYDAWTELIQDTPMADRLLDVITEENFDSYVEMHEAMQDGDFETATALADELGLEGPGMFGQGRGMHGGRMMGKRDGLGMKGAGIACNKDDLE